MALKCDGVRLRFGGVVPHVFALGGVARDIQMFGECDLSQLVDDDSALRPPPSPEISLIRISFE